MSLYFRTGRIILKAIFKVKEKAYGHSKAREKGSGRFDRQKGQAVTSEHLVLFSDGEQVAVSTAAEPVRFLLVSGKPIGEPVAWRGPIVMNTPAELKTAFEEYRTGTFIKHG
ncbi:MAG: hypothetical protein MUD16_18585 [Desulfobacterales bacterium]|jgi:hypothetical protein|nr:hypothetical protein [Desulfobacterales bacterium]